MLTEVGSFVFSENKRDTHTHDARHVFCAGPALSFLSTTIDERIDPDPTPRVQHPDTLGTMNLVRGKREKIDTQCFHIKGEFPRCLNSVGMHNDLSAVFRRMIPGDVRDFRNVVYRNQPRYSRT